MPNVVRIPVAAGAFDPADITLTDDTSGALLIKEGSNEYMRINTTNGSELTNITAGSAQGIYISGNSRTNVLTGTTDANSDFRIINSGGVQIFRVQGNHDTRFRAQNFYITDKATDTPYLQTDTNTNFTYTLDETSGAVFKVVDDAASPRTYFTATENGTVHVDGVKVGRGGGAIADNVAVGDGAFEATQTSFGNSVAVGYEAGKRQTNAYNSAFFGFRAGMGVTTGTENTAIGFGAMDGNTGTLSTTGTKNTAVGSSAVRELLGGNENVGIGYYSLNKVSSGSENVGLGTNAGDAITTGSGNIAIGHESDCAAAGVNQIAIGNGVVETTNNRASIGDSSNVATLDFSSAGNSWSTTSDVRIKENIQDSDLGLAFINSLRPVKHTSKDPTQWPEEIRMADPSGRTPEQLEVVKDGLIAQEVKAAADALGTTFSGWEQDANGLNRLQYERFVVPLIKAVQELSAQVEELKGDK